MGDFVHAGANNIEVLTRSEQCNFKSFYTKAVDLIAKFPHATNNALLICLKSYPLLYKVTQFFVRVVPIEHQSLIIDTLNVSMYGKNICQYSDPPLHNNIDVNMSDNNDLTMQNNTDVNMSDSITVSINNINNDTVTNSNISCDVNKDNTVNTNLSPKNVTITTTNVNNNKRKSEQECKLKENLKTLKFKHLLKVMRLRKI